jgi:hypothetical protein
MISMVWTKGCTRLGSVFEQAAQTPRAVSMQSRSSSVTRSRFERRVARGRHDLAFKVALGSDAAVGRYFGVSRMQAWRWRHDRASLPELVIKALPDLIQTKVAEAHLAQTEFVQLLREPPRPPRPLSGCCAGYGRKLKKIPRTTAEWADLGY